MPSWSNHTILSQRWLFRTFIVVVGDQEHPEPHYEIHFQHSQPHKADHFQFYRVSGSNLVQLEEVPLWAIPLILKGMSRRYPKPDSDPAFKDGSVEGPAGVQDPDPANLNWLVEEQMTAGIPFGSYFEPGFRGMTEPRSERWSEQEYRDVLSRYPSRLTEGEVQFRRRWDRLYEGLRITDVIAGQASTLHLEATERRQARESTLGRPPFEG